ncbi:MAG: hypothetical protein ACYDAP_00300 [Thermoplasmataceae archaeon]
MNRMNNVINTDSIKPKLQNTITKHSFIHYLQHKCAICGIKIEKEEQYYVALASFNMIHAYHMREGLDMK